MTGARVRYWFVLGCWVLVAGTGVWSLLAGEWADALVAATFVAVVPGRWAAADLRAWQRCAGKIGGP